MIYNKIFNKYGYNQYFGRTDIVNILKITASPASELIKKMLGMNLIYPIQGKGKGKYLFKKREV